MTFVKWLPAPTAMQSRALRIRRHVVETYQAEQRAEGAPLFLGATCPPNVQKHYPETCPDWDKYTPAQRADIEAAANEKQAEFASYSAQYSSIVADLKKDPSSCDATIPGSLANSLRDYLIKQGVPVAELGSDPNTFGPKEKAAWWKKFGRGVTYEDADEAVGVIWSAPGFKNIMLQTICPQASTKLPLVGPPGGPAVQPPPPPPPVTATAPKKSNWGLLLLAASALGAIWSAVK